MHAITQEQMDERTQRVLACQPDLEKAPFHRPLAEYQGKTFQEKIYFKRNDELSRLKNALEKRKNPGEFELKDYREKIKENEEDIADQIRLANRHDKNLVWIGRMKCAGRVAYLSAILALSGGMVSVPFAGKEPLKNPITRTFGTVCALSLVASWASTLELGRLKRSNRRIVKSLNTWHILEPSEKRKVKDREVYSVHQGLSGFLETFERG